jgi:hypothetical protein
MGEHSIVPPEWRTHVLRLTVFPSAVFELVPWWERVVGQAPDESIRQRASGLLREQGPFEGGVLTLTAATSTAIIAPLRVDWVWSVDPERAAQ